MSDLPSTSRGTKRRNERLSRAQSKRILLSQQSVKIETLASSDEHDGLGSDEGEDFGSDTGDSSALESKGDEGKISPLSPSQLGISLEGGEEPCNRPIKMEEWTIIIEEPQVYESPELASEEATTYWGTSSSSMKQIPFIRKSELLIERPSRPIDYFSLFFPDNYLRMIVNCTNKYATCLKRSRIHRHYLISRWKELTIEELKTYLGLLLHTGTAKMNRLSDYWKVHWLYMSCFPQYMSYDRFIVISRCLHLTIPEEDVIAGPLNKCQKIVDNFNNIMREVYYPGKNLSLYESMALWHSHRVTKKYINGKHRSDVKLYVLAEPDGMLLNVHVFASTEDETAGKDHSEEIVEKLTENKLDVGHSLYMDNFYNSYNLANKLLQRLTYCTGTLNKKRKDNPHIVTKMKLKRGENISRYRNGVHIGKWNDKKEILYISTEFAENNQEVTGKCGGTTVRPLALQHYKENISRVDLQDEMISYYPFKRKTLHWFLQIFIHTMMMSLVNSRLLYNKFSGEPELSFYDFRENIIEHLLPEKVQIPKSPSRNTNVLSHKLTKLDKVMERILKKEPEKKVLAVARKDCRNCFKNRKRRTTAMECKDCPESPPMCLECFFILHNCIPNKS